MNNKLPTNAIATDQTLNATSENWFDYPIEVYPHHTDYAGIVWHGHYLTWMEEARIEQLKSLGINYSDLVKLGCELPVVELSLRYHRPLTMGSRALVRARMSDMKGVKLHWDYRIESENFQELYTTARVTLVGIDQANGKIMRQLPPVIESVLTKIHRPC